MPCGAINQLAAFPRIIAISDNGKSLVSIDRHVSGGLEVGCSPILSSQSEPQGCKTCLRALQEETRAVSLTSPSAFKPLPLFVPFGQSPTLLLPCWQRNFFPVTASARMQRTHKPVIGNWAWLGLWEKAEHLSAELSAQQPALFSCEPLRLNFSAKFILMGIFLVASKSHASFGKSQPVPTGGEKCASCKTWQVFQDGTSPDGFSCFLCQREKWLRARAFYGEGSAPCHSRGPQGQDWDKRAMAAFEIRHFSSTGDQRTDPGTSKLKDKYSFCCSLGTSGVFSRNQLLVSLVTPLGKSKCTWA